MPTAILLLDGLAGGVLTALALTDLRSRRLPRVLMLPLLGLVLLRAGMAGGATGLALSLASGFIAAGPIWALRRILPRDDARWKIGGGDLRLAFILGSWLGAVPALVVLAIGSALAGLTGLVAVGLVAIGLGRGFERPQPLGSWCIAALAVGWLATWL